MLAWRRNDLSAARSLALSGIVSWALLLTEGRAQAAAPAPVRRATFALVEAEPGQPLAEAVVTFVGSVPHLGPAVAPRDVLQVATDARGRAQAKLDPQLCYVAWAIGPAGADGARAVSLPHGYFSAGALFQLRCDEMLSSLSVEVVGAEAWRHRGPLRYCLLGPFGGPEQELPIDGEGRLSVPSTRRPSIEVRLFDGQPLLHSRVEAGRLVIPPPRSVPVVVTDELGAPLAGASVSHRVVRLSAWNGDGLGGGGIAEDRVRLLGATDASGRIVVEVPYAADPLRSFAHGDLLLSASVPNRALVMGGIKNNTWFENDRKAHALPAGEIRFALPRTEPLAGVCTDMPAGSVAHLTGVCKLLIERTDFTHDTRASVAPIGADGRFAFLELPAELQSCRLTILPPVGRQEPMRLFAAEAGRTLPPEVLFWGDAGGPPFADLEVSVLEPAGGPARGVVAFLVPKDLRGILTRDSLIRFPLDVRGAALLRLTPGHWIVTVQSAAGWVAQPVELERALTRLELTMAPLAAMHVELRDANGAPIAGAAVQSRGTTTRGSTSPVQTLLQSLRSLSKAEWGSRRTDAAGRIVIPFVPVDGMSQRLSLQWRGGSSVVFELTANETFQAVLTH